MRITVLCDNSVGPIAGAIGEHGFAALLEPVGGEPLLFDTGQGFALLHNARSMGKDLSRVRKVLLSHGHHDHAGGLMALLRDGIEREVFAHETVFQPRYRVKDTGESYPIGMPHSREEYEAAGARFSLSADLREIAAGVMLTGGVPRVTPFEVGDRGLFRDSSGKEVDTTPDDQSLVIDTAKGLVVLLGCCHAGIVNTLEHVSRMTGRRDFHAVVGGTHLGFCGNEQFEQTVAALKRVGIKKLAVSHCTGFAAAARLSREMPKEFQPAMVGYTLEV
jgi:7,8-dihydropterin-6-yl-methyl-4-(beta-D-ribofuranosyl)aminobenzene 5'-phosphate synthase